MKRRSFLRMLGLAPIVAASPSLALPKPSRPDEMVQGKSNVGEAGPDLVHLTAANIGTIAFGSIRSRQSVWLFDGASGELRLYA